MERDRIPTLLNDIRLVFKHMTKSEQLSLLVALIETTSACARQFPHRVRESDAAAKRRKAKGRETEVDPKPPVRPVSVAEPSKPKKPKYRGL